MTYLLFTYDVYYPQGGISDCRKVFSADSDNAAIMIADHFLAEQPTPDNYDLVRLGEDGYTIVRYDGRLWRPWAEKLGGMTP